MDSYVTNRESVAAEKYGSWVNSISTYKFTAESHLSGTNTAASSSNSYSDSSLDTRSYSRVDNVYYTSSSTSFNQYASSHYSNYDTVDPPYNDEASEYGSSRYADTSSSYDDNGYSASSTYTYETLRTYVSFDTVTAYQSNTVIVSSGSFDFPYWSTSSSTSTQTAWTNANQTKTSTTTTYWNKIMSSLPRNTTSTTKTINSNQNYSYNRTSEDTFTEYSDYTYTDTLRLFGGSNYLRDTIVFNNANIGGSNYLNGGAAYTLSAAVGVDATVTGKFTDLFGLQTAPMFTFQDNQVFLVSERNDLIKFVSQSKFSVGVTNGTGTDTVTTRSLYTKIGTVSKTKTGNDSTFYEEKYTTNVSFSGVGSYAVNYPAVGTTPSYSEISFSHTEFEWGYSYPTNAVLYYTSKTQTVGWLGFAPEGTGTKMFYQDATYTTEIAVQERGEATRTHLVASYVSCLSGTGTGQSFVGSIRKTSTLTYLKDTTIAMDVVTPVVLGNLYTYGETDSGGRTYLNGISDGCSYTHKTNFRMQLVTLAATTEFASACEIVHSCLPIGYAGAANSYNASQNVTGINVAKSAVISMISGGTFNSQDVLATSHLPTAEFFDHVTYFPDSIPSSWTIKPLNAALISYLGSVSSIGSPASIKVWWTATTSTSTNFPSYKVFKGATSASKNTTTSRYTVNKATYVLSTVGAITGDFITVKPISLIGMGNGFSTGYCDINTSNMPTPVSVNFPAGAVDLTYQTTGNSGASSSGSFSTSNSNGQISFVVTNGKPFAFLAQPIISFARSYQSYGNDFGDHIVSTFKYIPPASY